MKKFPEGRVGMASDIKRTFGHRATHTATAARPGFAVPVEPVYSVAAEEVTAVAAPLVAPDILAGLAPIITADNRAARRMLALLHNIPHEALGRAQSDMLWPVWEALEKAEAGTPVMAGADRPDIPFTAEGLHALSCAVTRNMCVAQMQVPAIISGGVRPQLLLDSEILDAGDDFKGSDMEASANFVKGSGTYVCPGTDDAARDMSSRFGFIIIHKKETHDTASGAVQVKKLVALPVITIDEQVLENTLAHGGEEALRHLQMIGGLFNHDYFHHLTARVVNPYFNEKSGTGIPITKTPYGVLMGEGHKVAAGPGEQEADILGMERMPHFSQEKYRGHDAHWRAFNQTASYEFHALHMHNVLYRDYLDPGFVGAALRGHVAGYMDGVAAVARSMYDSGVPDADIETLKIYYSNLMGFHLLRVVPFGHPVMELLEKKVEALQIDQKYMRRALLWVADAADIPEGTHAAAMTRLSERTGLDPARVRHADVGAAEAVRACSFLMAERVLNPIYHPRYEEPRRYALSALRQVLSTVQRDMNVVEMRGGADVAYNIMAARREEPAPGMMEQMLRRLDMAM